jgi:acetyl-CoA C-acetyltransferase
VSAIDPSTPVLVGWYSVSRRDADPRDGQEAAELMASAARGALRASGVDAAGVDWIGATAGLTRYADPARLVAQRIGTGAVHTVLAHIGVMQQTLISHACRAVQTGTHQVALVVGGEAHYRKVRALARGFDPHVTTQAADVLPDESLTSPDFDESMSHPAEVAAGLSATPAYYALIDSFWRSQNGRGIEEHRDDLARVYARFAAIAQSNPDAVRANGYRPDELRGPSASNPMLAFPYTKLLATTWTVDQGCALVVTTHHHADELGVPDRARCYPAVAVESNHVVPVASRTRLSQPAAMRIIGETISHRMKRDVSEIELLDLYSAFPAPVFIGAQALRVPAGRDLTLTGGMSFAGGPLNSYVLHAIAAAAQRLTASDADAALVSSVSGLYSKQGALVITAQAPAEAFETIDVTEAVAGEEPPLPVVVDAQGTARVVAYTVVFEGDRPERAIVVVDVADGRRAVARSHDQELMASALTDDIVGAEVALRDGIFTLS